MELDSSQNEPVIKAAVEIDSSMEQQQIIQSTKQPSHHQKFNRKLIRERKQIKRRVALRCKAATAIQARFRGYISRRNHQSVIHTAKTKKEVQLHLTRAATLIQSVYRGHNCVKRYASILNCQSLERKKLDICHVKVTTRLNNAAIIIQAAYRSHFIRVKTLVCLLQHVAATTMQACIRGYIARIKYSGTISGMELHRRAVFGVSVQQFCRAYSARVGGKKSHDDSTGQTHTPTRSGPRKGSHLALRLQAMYRGFRARRQFCKAINASIAIQSCWRGYICRSDYDMMVMDVVTVQSIARRWLAYNQTERMRSADYPTDTSPCSSDEFVDDLASCCSDSSSLEDDMIEEMQLSFEEEMMSELQIVFHEEITRLHERICEVAASFW